MIGKTNAGGGGGGLQSTDAILRVIAPAGSTVTISKGGVSKSDLGHENASDNTLFDYYFIIHASQFDSINPWTVTATLGTNVASDTVVIDTAYDYDVLLLYIARYYDAGNEFSDITGGWIATGSTGSSGGSIVKQPAYLEIKKVYGGNISAMTTNSIDLSGYNTLHFEIESQINNSSNQILYGVSIAGGSNVEVHGTTYGNTIYNTRTHFTVDISSTSIGHPCVRSTGSTNTPGGSMFVYKVYAE